MRRHLLIAMTFAATVLTGCRRPQPNPGAPSTPPERASEPSPSGEPLALSTMVLQLSHSKAITAMAFTADGRRLATAARDGSIATWDVASATRVDVVPNLGVGDVETLAWNGPDLLSASIGVLQRAKDGKKLASLRALAAGGPSTSPFASIVDNGIVQLDTSLRRVARFPPLPSGSITTVPELAVSSSGAVAVQLSTNNAIYVARVGSASFTKVAEEIYGGFVWADDDRLVVQETGGARVLDPFGSRAPVTLAERDAKLTFPLATVGDLAFGVVDGRGYRTHRTIGVFGLDGKAVSVPLRDADPARFIESSSGLEFSAIAVAGEGPRVAAGTGDGRVLLFEGKDAKFSGLLGHTARPAHSIHATNGGRLVVRYGDAVATWDVTTGQRTGLRTVQGLAGVAPRPDGGFYAARTLAKRCEAGKAGLAMESWIYSDVAHARKRSGARLTCERPSNIDVRRAVPSRLPPLGTGEGECQDVSPLGWRMMQGQALARGISVLRRHVSEPAGQFAFGPAPVHLPYVAIDRREQREVLLEGSENTFILNEGRPTFTQSPGPIVSDDGRRLAAPFSPGSGSISDRGVLVWDVSTGKRLFPAPGDPIPKIDPFGLSADGQWLAWAWIRFAGVLHFDDDGRVSEFATFAATEKPISAIHPLGPARALIGTQAGELIVAEPTQPHEVGQDPSHRPVWRIVPLGPNSAATLDDGGQVTLWRLDPPRPVARLVDFADGEWLATSPSGHFMSSLRGEDRIVWQPADDPQRVVRFRQYPKLRDPDAVVASIAGERVERASLPAAPPLLTAQLEMVTDDTAQVRADIELSPGDAATVFVFREGRPVIEQHVSASGSIEGRVPLMGDDNVVTVEAFSDHGVASPTVVLDAKGERASRPDLWTIAVGISDYPMLPRAMQLRVADDDAHALTEYLARHTGPGRAYADLHATRLTNADATMESILAALEGLAEMDADDLAVVLLSGHGVFVDGRAVFLTSEATPACEEQARASVSWAAIRKRLRRAPGRVLLLLDACHAGAVRPDLFVSSEAIARELGEAGRAGAVILAASRGEEESEEGSWNGLFTGALLSTLSNPGSDYDGDGWLRVSEVATATRQRVRRDSEGRQTPQLAQAEVFGDFRLFPAAGRGER